MASGGSKRQRRLRDQEAELLKKRNKGYVMFACGLIVFILFLIVRTALLTLNIISTDNMVLTMSTYMLAVVAAGVVGIGARDFVRANGQLKAIRSQMR